MKERRKDTKKQKEERRHRDVMKYTEGFNQGFYIGYRQAQIEHEKKQIDEMFSLSPKVINP